MNAALILLALIIPVLLGGLWLRLLIPAHWPARAAMVWGNGTLLGLLALPQLMRAVDGLGLPLTLTTTATPAIALIAIALLVSFFRRQPVGGKIAATAQFPTLSTAQRVLFIFLLTLVILRLITLGLEVFWRPLFPWDATMHWATKARVWFEHESMTPFISHDLWLKYGGDGAFTDRHPGYPATIPLLQVWMNLGTRIWDESLMNLPWLLCLTALALAFYGQMRAAGASAIIAMTFTYLLISMPLIDIHVALAGYADLFLGASYCAALMALHNWTISRKAWQGLLALLFALACTLIKNEGAIWPLTLIPAVGAVFMARREAAKLLVLLGLVGILLWLLLPENLIIFGHTLKQLTPAFNFDALVGVVQSIFLHDSWHLFAYMMLVLMPLGLLMPGAISRKFLPITVALACSVGAFLFLFVFTGFGWGAANFTAVGRLSIQLAPGLAFLGALLFNELFERGGLQAPDKSNAVSSPPSH